jgi:hypothetical protein
MTDEGLHLLARVLLRLCSPQRAHEILTRVGGLLHPHADRSELLRAGRRMRSHGTCLSRALAVAARAPQAEIVIGVLPRRGQRLLAHAWLEVCGMPLNPSDVVGTEIARI